VKALPQKGNTGNSVCRVWPRLSSLRADQTRLYWITFDRRLMRVAKTGGQATTLLQDVGLYDACDSGIAVDTDHLDLTGCCDPGSTRDAFSTCSPTARQS